MRCDAMHLLREPQKRSIPGPRYSTCWAFQADKWQSLLHYEHHKDAKQVKICQFCGKLLAASVRLPLAAKTRVEWMNRIVHRASS